MSADPDPTRDTTAARRPAEPVRRLWWLLEPVHAVSYFTPEGRDAFRAAGVRRFWDGYFAGRAAPFGPVHAGPVTAAFFGFHPDMVRRALPAVWEQASPEQALAARAAGAAAALRRVRAAGHPDDAGLGAAADLLLAAAARCDPAGRPVFAANQELPAAADPAARLWQGATLLREHRGDGHVAMLLTAGLDGCGSHVLTAAGRPGIREFVQPARGFSDDDWAAATARLADRGLLDADGLPTGAGRAERRAIEAGTDRLALPMLDALGAAGAARVAELVTPLTRALIAAQVLPYRSPLTAELGAGS